MAVATSLALGAAALSGCALGLSCGARSEAAAADSANALGAQQLQQVQQMQAAETLPYQPYGQPQLGMGQQPGGTPHPLMMQDTADGWQGFSMEEARAHADEEQRKAMARTPVQVLADLQRGNARFWMNLASRPEKSAFERRALISKQFPSVAILGCADSRVPVEIVFDQGLGDLFVIRVAGNCIDTATKASLQYAVHHLKVKVIVVMGHEMCGSVKAAMHSNEELEQEPTELAMALKALKFGLDEDALSHVQDGRARDREAVVCNIRKQIERLTSDAGIMSKVNQRDVMIVGAFYEISSGIVDFFFEVSQPETPQEGNERARQLPDASPPSRGVQSRFVLPPTTPQLGSRGLAAVGSRRYSQQGPHAPMQALPVLPMPAAGPLRLPFPPPRGGQ